MTGGGLRAVRHNDGRGLVRGAHAHAEGQFMLGLESDVEVRIGPRRIHVPMGEGLWLPPGVPHASRGLRKGMVSLFVPGHRTGNLPPAIRAVAVTGPLPGLIAWLADSGTGDPRILDAALALLEHAMGASSATMAADDPLDVIASAVTSRPDDPRGIADWAAEFDISARSLLRLIKARHGLTWRDWRRGLSLDWAASALGASAASVSDIAATAGYATPSAFSAAFRRRYGCEPTRWRRSPGAERN
ncbi:MAG: AraC family transcriptional regulator [Pseudomonadota bacterium]|nr:AraC family transcriptional regulator [Pseudomonadota bacterium]